MVVRLVGMTVASRGAEGCQEGILHARGISWPTALDGDEQLQIAPGGACAVSVRGWLGLWFTGGRWSFPGQPVLHCARLHGCIGPPELARDGPNRAALGVSALEEGVILGRPALESEIRWAM